MPWLLEAWYLFMDLLVLDSFSILNFQSNSLLLLLSIACPFLIYLWETFTYCRHQSFTSYRDGKGPLPSPAMASDESMTQERKTMHPFTSQPSETCRFPLSLLMPLLFPWELTQVQADDRHLGPYQQSSKLELNLVKADEPPAGPQTYEEEAQSVDTGRSKEPTTDT